MGESRLNRDAICTYPLVWPSDKLLNVLTNERPEMGMNDTVNRLEPKYLNYLFLSDMILISMNTIPDNQDCNSGLLDKLSTWSWLSCCTFHTWLPSRLTQCRCCWWGVFSEPGLGAEAAVGCGCCCCSRDSLHPWSLVQSSSWPSQHWASSHQFPGRMPKAIRPLVAADAVLAVSHVPWMQDSIHEWRRQVGEE